MYNSTQEDYNFDRNMLHYGMASVNQYFGNTLDKAPYQNPWCRMKYWFESAEMGTFSV